MRQNINEYEVPSPRDLTGCAEFTVDSQASDPHFAGPIDVRVEPKRIGFRWSGCKDWAWADYHEALGFAGDCGKAFREMLTDLKEQAREEGMKAGLEEAMRPPEERKPTVHFLLMPERDTESAITSTKP